MQNSPRHSTPAQLIEENNQLKRLLVEVMMKQSRSESMGRVFHDFNNMLSSTLGYASLGLERVAALDDDKLQRYLSNIERAAIRARDLVRECLDQRQQDRQASHPACIARELSANGVEVKADSELDLDKRVTLSSQDLPLMVNFLLRGKGIEALPGSKDGAPQGVVAHLQCVATEHCEYCDTELPMGAMRVTLDWTAAGSENNGGGNNNLMDFLLAPAMVNMSGGHMCEKAVDETQAVMYFRTLHDDPM